MKISKKNLAKIEKKLFEIWCNTGDKWMDAINKIKIKEFMKWFKDKLNKR
jgi:hypothetical protein